MTGKRYGTILGLALSAVACFGQPPSPESEQALRERIGKFYQAHVDGKYRQAEQFIAEENRDDFYTQAKTKYLSYAGSKIEYTDNGAKAVVHTPTEMLWRVAQLGEMKLNKLVESNWKVVDGQWYWYQPPGYGLMVPFGPDGKPIRMSPGPKNEAAKPVSVSEAVRGFNQSSLFKVSVNKSQVQLSKQGGLSDELLVKNTLDGVIQVQVDHNDLPGLEVTVTPAQVKPGETAKIRFQYTPPSPEPNPKLGAKITIQPTMQSFPLAIIFGDKPEAAAAPAVKK